MTTVLAGKMGQITPMEVKYLEGGDSGYHNLYSFYHSVSVKAVAIHLERFVLSFRKRCRRSLATAFKWLMRYDNYIDDYKNSKKNRRFMDEGLVGEFFAI